VSGKKISLKALALFCGIAAATPSAVYLTIPLVLAESTNASTTFPLPKNVKSGTVVQINGSRSMAKINEALAQEFEKRFSGTDVKVSYEGTKAALKAVLDDKNDLAAIGRPLTDAEKAKGLVAIPVTRNKIAMIVGKNSPFKDGLTINQFAQIFRGQVTDWSKLGGPKVKIRLVDRPDSSDTRQAFQNYPVFKSAPFKTGGDVIKLKQDSTEAVINALGNNGIGYAIADQVVKNPNVRVVPMHNVAPTDPRYPFSQPLSYVYKGPKPSPGVQAFLGYATASDSQKVVETARVANAKAQTKTTSVAPQKAQKAVSGENSRTLEATKRSANLVASNQSAADETLPWWLPYGLLGGLGLGLLGWWLKRKDSQVVPTAVASATAVARPPVTTITPVAAASFAEPRLSRIVITPRNSKSVYAFWEIPDEVKQDMRQQGGRDLKVRLYDVTDIDMSSQTPHSVQEFDCNDSERDLHIPITESNRDYIAELGYVTDDGRWLEIAGSEHVRVPGDQHQASQFDAPNIPMAGAALAGVAAVGAAVKSFAGDRKPRATDETNNARVVLVPHSPEDAYVYWEIPEERKAELEGQGGRLLGLRLYDTTGINLDEELTLPTDQYDCTSCSDLHIQIPRSDRDYVAELGYVTEDGDWLKIARSETVKVPSSRKNDDTTTAVTLPTSPASPTLTNGATTSTTNTPSKSPLEAAKAAASNLVGNIAHKASDVIGDTAATLGTAKNAASNLTGNVAGQIAGNITNKASDVSGDAAISLDRGKNNADNIAVNIVNKTSDVVGDTTKLASDVVGNATTKASGFMGEATKSVGATLAGGAAAVAGVGAVARSFFDKQDKKESPKNDTRNGHRVAKKKQCQIIVVPRNSQSAYVYWEVSDDYKQVARNQGGRKLTLRVHDATNLDIDYYPPHSTQEYPCSENQQDKHISIPLSDRDYIAELGYYTEDNRWLIIIRSFHVHVPA
jgi:phosphate transport system substrate-binding protein